MSVLVHIPLLSFRWRPRQAPAHPVDPLHCDVPALRDAEIAAVYYDHRIAGDFYEFLRVGRSRLLFALLDMAGRRADTRETLIATQTTFRTLAPQLFAGEDFNEATAMMKLCTSMNRAVLARGVRSCPAFLGCYNEETGTVCFANAGHTPAMLWDGTGVTLLEATGLPLGLFSHTVHSASTCALVPGAALLAVSRGIVEAEHSGEEFGLERTKQCLERATAGSAHGLCRELLHAVQSFTQAPPTHNDVTTLALVRQAGVGGVPALQ
jgi:phosphoserine phosphatase RsbU/P